MRESDFLNVAAKFRFCSIFIDINALDYYMKPKHFLLSTSCLNWIPTTPATPPKKKKQETFEARFTLYTTSQPGTKNMTELFDEWVIEPV